MAVLEDAIVCGVDVLGVAEVGGQTGVGREFGVEGQNYAVVEELICEGAGEGGGGVRIWGDFPDDGHAGEVLKHATWMMRGVCQSSTLTSDHLGSATIWVSSLAGEAIIHFRQRLPSTISEGLTSFTLMSSEESFTLLAYSKIRKTRR